MTDGRPPNKGAPSSEADAARDEEADGRRSQTRSVDDGRAPSGSQQPLPRATFAPAPSAPPKPSAPQHTPPPRSVFQHAPDRAGLSDPDKTVKRPYPSNPNAWGQTIQLGGAVPPQAGPEPDEKTVQVARTAFANSLRNGEAPSAAAERGSGPEQDGAAVPEPLRTPSNRPTPAPWNASRQGEARKNTLLMPGTPGTHPPPGHANAAHAAKAPGVPAMAKQTLPMSAIATGGDTRAPAPPSANAQAAPAPSPGSARPESSASARPERRAAPAAPHAGRGRAAAPAAPAGGESAAERLRLQLDADDILPQSALSERPGIARNRGPVLAVGLIVALIAVAIGWFAWGSEAPAADVPAPEAGLRNSAVLAPADEAAAAPPSEAAKAEPEEPAAKSDSKPTAAAQAPQPPNSREAPAAEPRAKPARPESKPSRAQAKREAEREAARARARAKARRAAAAPPVRDETAARPVSPEVPENVQEAREALRALESEPVINIKPTQPGDAADADEPVLKLSPGADEIPEPPPLPEPPSLPEP